VLIDGFMLEQAAHNTTMATIKKTVLVFMRILAHKTGVF